MIRIKIMIRIMIIIMILFRGDFQIPAMRSLKHEKTRPLLQAVRRGFPLVVRAVAPPAR